MPPPKPSGLSGVLLLTILLLGGVLTSSTASAQVAQGDEAIAGIEIEVLRSGAGASVIPVQVNVVSRRAVDGTIELRAPNMNISWELPVGLAANSEVSQLFAVPTAGRSSVELTATLIVDGSAVAEDESERFAGSANAVGLLGLSATSEEVQLRPELGVASITEMDDLAIMPALDTVVTSPAGLRSLTEIERTNLLQWVAGGRQLAVADVPGSIDAVLPVEWQSSDQQVFAGTGVVRYIGVDWSTNVPPGISTATNSQFVAGWFQPSSPELLSDAGFRVPGLGAMSILLLVYLVLAGPVTFVVLSQIKRQTLAWIVVPALAVIFAVGVFGVGRVLSSTRGNGYASIVEVSPAGASVTESILIAKSGGQNVELPEGWSLQSTGLTTGNGDVGAPVVVSPKRSTTNLRFDIDAGSGGTAILRGSVPVLQSSIGLANVSLDGTTLRGTVRNETVETLENVSVMVGARLTSVGTVRAGEAGEFVLDLAMNPNRFAPELRTWNVDPRDGQFGPRREDRDIDDGPVNGTSWLEWRASRLGSAVPEGMITAVGWSRDLDGALLGGTGRTALVTHAQLPAPDGPLAPAQVRTLQLLVPGQDRFGGFDGFEPFDGGGIGLVSQYVRPPGADTSELAIEVQNQITEVELWSADDTWRSLKLDDIGGLVTISIPEEAWNQDVLTVRYTISDFFGEPGQLATRLAASNVRTQAGELLEPGETSRRNANFENGPDFGDQDAVLGIETDVEFDAEGTFESGGELFGTYDEWRFELSEGDEVQVRMNANQNLINGSGLDPFIAVRDPSGAQIAENDDFDGLNSGLEFTADTDGTFVLETRPLGGSQSSGSYTVRIDATFSEGGDE